MVISNNSWQDNHIEYYRNAFKNSQFLKQQNEDFEPGKLVLILISKLLNITFLQYLQILSHDLNLLPHSLILKQITKSETCWIFNYFPCSMYTNETSWNYQKRYMPPLQFFMAGYMYSNHWTTRYYKSNSAKI